MAMKTYTAPHSVYLGSKLYAAGEPFTTADRKGEQWEEVTKSDKVATKSEKAA